MYFSKVSGVSMTHLMHSRTLYYIYYIFQGLVCSTCMQACTALGESHSVCLSLYHTHALSALSTAHRLPLTGTTHSHKRTTDAVMVCGDHCCSYTTTTAAITLVCAAFLVDFFGYAGTPGVQRFNAPGAVPAPQAPVARGGWGAGQPLGAR
jgi:hypothetical protein